MKLIDWNEQFKIRTTQCIESRDKHEVVKLLLVRNLIRNHSKDKRWVRIYTEFEVSEGIVCDVYFENIKTKEKYAFEIQKKTDEEKINKKIDKYSEWKDPFFTTDLLFVDLNKVGTDIKEINQYLGGLVV